MSERWRCPLVPFADAEAGRWSQAELVGGRGQRDPPMFQVPMKMVIMSGSGCSECLFFICCNSWQKPSLF